MTLAERVRQAWDRDTSANPQEWAPDRPSRGQCAVTALVVQDHLGGDLLRVLVNGESHYWNRLPDGTELDLTRDQFTLPHVIGGVVVRPREYVLSHPETVSRYTRLASRVPEETP